jgi:hypothetical protein
VGGAGVGGLRTQLALGSTREEAWRRREPQTTHKVNVRKYLGFVGPKKDPAVDLVDLARPSTGWAWEGKRRRSWWGRRVVKHRKCL